MWDEVHGQLHGVTGKVQQVRLIVAVQRCAMCEWPCWSAFKFKIELIWNGKSKPRFRVNRIPGAGVKYPLSWAQDIPLVRGMG